MERGKKSKFGWAVLAGVMALFGAGISRGFVIGEFDFGILEDEPGAVDVALSPGDKTRDSLFIPSSVEIDGTRYNVTKVRDRGFQKLSSPYIRIPESVRCLGEHAFNHSQLGELDVEGEGFDSIADGAFYGIKIPRFNCNILPRDYAKMQKISFGDMGGWNLYDGNRMFELAEIGELIWSEWLPQVPCQMFDPASISKVVIPPTVSIIGIYAFGNSETPSPMDTIIIPDNVWILGFAFWSNCWVSCLQLGEGCEIEPDAFSPNFVARRLVVPSRTILHPNAFRTWTELEEVDFAGDVDFSKASGLFLFADYWDIVYPLSDVLTGRQKTYLSSAEPKPLTVIYRTSDPQETKAYLFNKSTFEEGRLYVEDAGVEKARRTFPWRQFKTILPLSQYLGAEGVTPDATTDGDLPEEVYTLDGIRLPGGIENLRPGTYIVRRGADVRKIRI